MKRQIKYESGSRTKEVTERNAGALEETELTVVAAAVDVALEGKAPTVFCRKLE